MTISCIEQYFSSQAAKYQSWYANPLWSLLKNKEISAVESLLAPLKSAEVLDLGSANGIYAKRLLQLGAEQIHCVDLSRPMLELFDSPKVKKICMDIEDYHPSQSYDLVLAAGSLEFLRSPKDCFLKFSLALKQGGSFVLFLPENGIWGRHYRRFHQRNGLKIHLFDFNTVIEWGLEAGLCCDKIKRVFPSGLALRFINDR